jgi:hypothetical protein
METNKTLLTYTHTTVTTFFYHSVNTVTNTTCFKTYKAKRLTKYLKYTHSKTPVFRRTYYSFNHSPPQQLKKKKEDNKTGSLLITVATLRS